MKQYMDIIKWIVYDTVPWSQKLVIDQSKLSKIILMHDLAGRFLLKIKEYKIVSESSFSHEFIASMREIEHSTKNQVLTNIKAILEITKHLSKSNILITIKGFTTYLLRNKESLFRKGDNDVLCNDYDELIEVLKKLGYTQTRSPFQHELGEYSKASVEIDIHKYFPVFSYPKDLFTKKLIGNPNKKWCQNFQMSYSKIDIRNLEQHFSKIKLNNEDELSVGDPNIMVIIVCSHLFLNFVNVWSISHREKPYVRLSELADIFELVNHPEFDQRIFLSLVKEFNATDAVTWVANIASLILNKIPEAFSNFEIFDKKLLHKKFPRCLWWNFWISLKLDQENLIDTNWYPIEEIIKTIGANYITITKTDQKSNDQYLNKMIHYISLNDLNCLEDIKFIKNTMSINLHLSIIVEDVTEFIRIRTDFKSSATEIVYSTQTKKFEVVGEHAVFNVIKKDKVCFFTIQYETNNFENSKMLMNLGILQQVNDQNICGLYIPIVINL